MKVKRNGSSETVQITADGEGLCAHAGALALSNLSDRLGLTAELSKALSGVRKRRGRHDPGEVIRDLAVVLAQGGEHLADLAALRDQPDLFGSVASGSTAFRLIDAIGPSELEAISAARAKARERAFELGARPKQMIIDLDATLTGSHSDKEGAAGTWKKGFGFHPMLSFLEGSDCGLTGKLRPGNAGSNTAADQITVLEAALEQLPADCMDAEILVRADGAGAVHELLDFCHEGRASVLGWLQSHRTRHRGDRRSARGRVGADDHPSRRTCPAHPHIYRLRRDRTGRADRFVRL